MSRFKNYLKALFTDHEGTPHIRGSEFISQKDAEAVYLQTLRPGEPWVLWGACKVPVRLCNLGFRIAGVPGSGKTTLINMMLANGVLRGIVPDSDHRAYIFDAKNSYVRQLRDLGLSKEIPIRHIHPFAEDGLAWDMARDITTDRSAESVAKILFPREGEATGNAIFFKEAEQLLLSAVMTSFLYRHPGAWTLRDILNASASQDDLKAILMWAKEDAVNQRALWRFFPQHENPTVHGVLMGIDNKVKTYATVAARWHHAALNGRTFSLTEWARKPSVLVFGHHDECEEAINALHRLLFKRMSQIVLDLGKKDDRRTWIFLDELAAPGKLDGLDQLFLRGRDFGVSLVLGFQEISKLEQIYGEDGARSILNLAQFTAVLKVTDETARWAEERFGDEQFAHDQTSQGSDGRVGTTRLRLREPLVLHSEFPGLGLMDEASNAGPHGIFNVHGNQAYLLKMTMAEVKKLTAKPVAGAIPTEHRPGVNLDRFYAWIPEERARLGLPARPDQRAKSRDDARDDDENVF